MKITTTQKENKERVKIIKEIMKLLAKIDKKAMVKMGDELYGFPVYIGQKNSLIKVK